MLRYSKVLVQSCIDTIKTQRFRFAWVILDSNKGIYLGVFFWKTVENISSTRLFFFRDPLDGFWWVPSLDAFIPFALDRWTLGQAEEKRRLEVSCGWRGGPTENWTWKSNKTLPGRKRTSSQSLRRYSAWACHLVLGLLFMLWDCIGLPTCVKEFCSSAVWVFLQPV